MRVLVTRHGQCVHNLPGGNALWRLGNDDIMGLTEAGIKQTCEKAELLASMLNPKLGSVHLVATNSIRSKQTASLLRTELRRMGFQVESLGKAGPLWDEVPNVRRATPEGWSKFKLEEGFHADPFYAVEGVESFLEKYLHWSDSLQDGLEIQGGYGVQACIFVSHHYTLNAYFANVARGLLAAPNLQPDEIQSVEEHVFRAALKFKIPHDLVFEVTPSFRHVQTFTAETSSVQNYWKQTLELLWRHFALSEAQMHSLRVYPLTEFGASPFTLLLMSPLERHLQAIRNSR